MNIFVNRESELQLIDASFQTLLDGKHLLRTPIVEVQGVGGIGKTSLLRQIERRCQDIQLPCIWADLSRGSANIARDIIAQARKYIQGEDVPAGQAPTYVVKLLLEKGPVVLLFDAVDVANEEQLNVIETLLLELVDNEKLFVVFTSKKTLPFLEQRAVARKLTTFSLGSLDRKNCDFYVENQGGRIEPALRDLIFEWTHGYPLAMQIMVQAIGDGVDPGTEQGQKDMLSLLVDRVIHGEVLARVKPERHTYYYSILQLLSVPRRFNLVLMQDLIEEFAPELKRKSSMAYWGLPKEINDATDILSWSMVRAGFAVDDPVRHILLLPLKLEQPQRYFAIHNFLAQTNLNLAGRYTGTDRVRYIRESLYHIACDSASPLLSERLEQAMQVLLQEPPETFQQFSEEFSRDEELKEALGDHLASIQSTISVYLAQMKQSSEG